MKLHYNFLLFSVLCPFYAAAQIGPSPTPVSATTGATTNSGQTAQSQPAASPGQGAQNSSSTELNTVVVTGQLDTARDQIVPYLGATKYTIPQEQIQNESQGSNAPFNHVILQAARNGVNSGWIHRFENRMVSWGWVNGKDNCGFRGDVLSGFDAIFHPVTGAFY